MRELKAVRARGVAKEGMLEAGCGGRVGAAEAGPVVELGGAREGGRWHGAGVIHLLHEAAGGVMRGGERRDRECSSLFILEKAGSGVPTAISASERSYVVFLRVERRGAEEEVSAERSRVRVGEGR